MLSRPVLSVCSLSCPPKYRIPEINIHGCMDCGRKNGPMDWVPPMMKPVPGRINAVITQNYDPMVPQKPEPSEAEIKAVRRQRGRLAKE
eukprot:1359940-Amorphochlora_amoeboformis.AAC.1